MNVENQYCKYYSLIINLHIFLKRTLQVFTDIGFKLQFRLLSVKYLESHNSIVAILQKKMEAYHDQVEFKLRGFTYFTKSFHVSFRLSKGWRMPHCIRKLVPQTRVRALTGLAKARNRREGMKIRKKNTISNFTPDPKK